MNTLDKIHNNHTNAIKKNWEKKKNSNIKEDEASESDKIRKTEISHKNNKGNDDDEMFKYYMKTGTLLFQYYDRIENVEKHEKLDNLDSSKKDKILNSSNSVISYFKPISQKKEDSIERIEEKNSENDTNVYIHSFDEYNDSNNNDFIIDSEEDTKETLGEAYLLKDCENMTKKDDLRDGLQENFQENVHGNVSRETLRNLYLEKMEILDYKKSKHNTCNSIKEVSDYSPFQSHFCNECLSEMTCLVSEGVSECSNCGMMENIMIDSDKPNYRDIPKETNSYSYRRSNHFNEWIAQFQAKERTQIPRKVIYQIIEEIRKERIQNLSLIRPCKIRSILKKLKLNKFYEHIPHIINQINGKPPPVISRQTEERLRGMFNQIQNPFLEFCPKERKNFLSYSYVLHKFVELLEMPDLKPLFPLLKSREKLFQCDLIWKKICKKLDWNFIKSI
jgi:hypothetical protein